MEFNSNGCTVCEFSALAIMSYEGDFTLLTLQNFRMFFHPRERVNRLYLGSDVSKVLVIELVFNFYHCLTDNFGFNEPGS